MLLEEFEPNGLYHALRSLTIVVECHAKVYIGEILPQNVELCNRKWPVPYDFNDRVISVNKTVAELTSEIPQIKVLAADGVHMNTYLRSIIGAILHWTKTGTCNLFQVTGQIATLQWSPGPDNVEPVNEG